MEIKETGEVYYIPRIDQLYVMPLSQFIHRLNMSKLEGLIHESIKLVYIGEL